jgi:hypothetical protein
LVQTQGIHGKLFLTASSLLLLALVTYSGSFLEKGLAASDTHIVASGDWHCTNDAATTVNVAKSLKPQLILGLGDYSSTETESCWVNLSKPVDSITKIAFGNHDNENDGLANSYLNHYGLTKQFYSFDIKNVHVLTMATEEELGAGSEQYNFVVNDLRRSANNPDIKWIIVTMHNPVYSSPNGCSDSSCESNEELSELYHPLFDNYGVDIVLQAHVRNYQRSFPLEFNQESPLNPTVTSTSKGEYKNPNGAIFAIVGTGGGELKHELEESSPFMAYQQDTKFGILDMHFSDNILEGKFIATDGSTMDHFSLSKTAKKKVIERISDDTFSGANIRAVSDEKTANALPLAGHEAQDNKPSITFKLDEEATSANTNAKLAQDAKPSITFKLDEEAVSPSNSKVNPLAGQEAQEVEKVKPVMTSKVDDSPPAEDDKPMLLSEEQIKQEQVKPVMTSKVDDSPPAEDDKPMLLSEEQVKQEQVKPAMTTKVDDSPPKDDKAISLSEETSDEVKSATLNDNSDKSNVKELGTKDNSNNVMSDEDSGETVSTNLSDPFASLK